MCVQVKAKCRTDKVCWGGQTVQSNQFIVAKLRAYVLFNRELSKGHIHPESEEEEERTCLEVVKF